MGTDCAPADASATRADAEARRHPHGRGCERLANRTSNDRYGRGPGSRDASCWASAWSARGNGLVGGRCPPLAAADPVGGFLIVRRSGWEFGAVARKQRARRPRAHPPLVRRQRLWVDLCCVKSDAGYVGGTPRRRRKREVRGDVRVGTGMRRQTGRRGQCAERFVWRAHSCAWVWWSHRRAWARVLGDRRRSGRWSITRRPVSGTRPSRTPSSKSRRGAAVTASRSLPIRPRTGLPTRASRRSTSSCG